MIDFSNADKIYLGDIEVSKLYQGTELLYEKQSSGVIVEDGKLILLEGLVVNLEDYSAEEPTSVPYSLPENVTIETPDYIDKQFTDGTRFSFYADMEGERYEYDGSITMITDDSSTNYKVTQNIQDSLRLKDVPIRIKSGASGTPYNILIFRYNGNGLSKIDLTNSGSGSMYTLGISKAYLRDLGTTELDWVNSGFNKKDRVSWTSDGLVSPSNDTELRVVTSTYYRSVIWEGSVDTFKDGHWYIIYGISTKLNSSYVNQNLGYCTLRRETHYDNYNKDMYLTGSGYKFGDEGNVQFNATDREPQIEFGEQSFGIVKYDPVQGWYDLKSPN